MARFEGGGEAEALAELTRLRATTRRAIVAPAVGALSFGAVTVLCALVLAVTGDHAFVAAWLFLGIVTLMLLARNGRVAGVRSGAVARRRSVVPWSLAFFALCFLAALAAGHLHVHAAGVLATVVLVLVGYGMLGAWQRDPRPPAMAAGAAVPPLACAAAGAAPWLVEMAFGIGLLAAGLLLLTLDESR